MNQIEIHRSLLAVLNQLCDLEQKVSKLEQCEPVRRNIARMKDALEEMHLVYENPMGQAFDETRTDVEAHIAGFGTENLRIVEVMKPIIRYSVAGTSRIIQRGVVVVSEAKE